jgi:hypothetical protein
VKYKQVGSGCVYTGGLSPNALFRATS